jgi:phosphatidylserine/phosphatidylglycerophosphate/cardiolipin synthase-like enzyme
MLLAAAFNVILPVGTGPMLASGQTSPIAGDDVLDTQEDTSITTTTLTDNDFDPDLDESLSILSVVSPSNYGGIVSITLPNTITYSPPENFVGVDSFDYIVADLLGATDIGTVTVTVNPVNDPPVANDDITTADEDSSTQIDVLSNDIDVDEDEVSIVNPSDPAHGTISLDSNIGPVTYTPDPGFSGTDSFTYDISDGNSGTDTATVTINVASLNDNPIANAGSDTIVDEGDTVTLDGSLSNDPDGDSISYTWSQVSGPLANLPSNTNTQSISFAAPSVGSGGATLEFQLTVDDGEGGTSTDSIEITVNNVNSAPDAMAGLDRTVNENANVTLDGSSSTDPDGDVLTYSWRKVTGPTITLSNSGSSKPSFITPDVVNADITFTFELTVTDNGGLSSTSLVTLVVTNVNQIPTADAGPDQTVNEETSVTLSGANSSDPDSSIGSLEFEWTQMSGVPVILQNSHSITPSFIAPNVISTSDSLVFRLEVTDTFGSTDIDDMTVVVNNVAGYLPSNYSPSFTASGTSYYEIADSPGLRLSSFTAAAWFKTSSSYSGNVMIVNKGGLGSDSTGQNLNYGIYMNSAEKLEAGFETSTGADNFVISTNAYNDGRWHYAVVTFDGSIIRLYVDGVHIGTKSTTAKPESSGTHPMRIGANSRAMNNYFIGSIDEVRVWNRATSASETLDQFSLGKFSKTGLLFHFNGVCHICAPVANAGANQIVEENSVARLDGSSSSDWSGQSITYSWVQLSGTSVTLNSANVAFPTFTAPNIDPSIDALSLLAAGANSSAEILTFELTVTNSDGLSNKDTVDITVENINQPPIASAGNNQTVVEGGTVTLDSSGSSDPDLDSLSHSWSQTAGTSVTMNNPTSVNPSFTAPEVSETGDTLLFKLVVDDGHGGSSTDYVMVTVQHVNKAPVANAGPNQNVTEQTTVLLDGSASFDPDGDSISYSWIRISGPTVALSNASITSPTFVAPDVPSLGVLITLQLTVTDDKGLSNTDAVEIRVNNANKLPLAKAGNDQSVNEGSLVLLNSSLSTDPDGNVIQHNWKQTGGPPVSLIGAATSTATFTAPFITGASIQLTFEVTVTDDDQGTNSDSIIITITNSNQAPVAEAGPPQTVDEHNPVTLDGSVSHDNDGIIATFSWVQVDGPSATMFNSTTDHPTFEAPEAGSIGESLTFELTVTDNYGESSKDNVTIFVNNLNQPPIADAGPGQLVNETNIVTLDGTGSSDPDGDGLTYIWTQVGGPTVTLSDSSAAQPTFIAPEVDSDQIISFELMVHDGDLASALTDFVEIQVKNVNKMPSANAGADRTVNESTVVTLDGRASTDPDGVIKSYNWTQIAGPVVLILDANTSQSSFTSPNIVSDVSTLTFELKVTDLLGGTDTDLVDVVVNNIPGYSNNNYSPAFTSSSSSHFDIPDHPAIRVKTFAAAAWFKTTALYSSNAMILNKGGFGSDATGQNMNYGIWLDSAEKLEAGFETSTGADNFVISTKTYNDGKWHYAVVTFDGSIIRLYVDGVQIGTKSTTASPESTGTNPLRIGSNSRGTNNYFDGQIDEVRLWGRATSLQEIKDQYDYGLINKQDRLVYMNGVKYVTTPTANAGADQSVFEFDTVLLDGSASTDPDGDPLSYSWLQTAGPTVTLDDNNSISPAFQAPEVSSAGTTLTFELTVDDGDSTSKSDSVKITVKNINIAPTVNAGPDQTVDEGDAVTLDGSASSDPDGDPITYSWRQTQGPAVTLSGGNNALASFTAPLVTSASTLIFELTVNDGHTTNKDVVNVVINDIVGGYNYAPSFLASGSAYYEVPDSSKLHLQQFTVATWFKTSSSFSGDAAIANRGGFGSESAGQNMNYGIWMDVNEKLVGGFETSSGNDWFVTSPNTYNDGAWHYVVVTFDGSTVRMYVEGIQVGSKSTGSTPDSSGTQPFRIGVNSRGVNNYFTGEIDETRVWSRAVSSTEVSSQFNLSTFNLSNAIVYAFGNGYNIVPTADAGPDKSVFEEDQVTLNGAGSSDPNGDPLTYTWTQISGPGVTLTNANSVNPQFTAPIVTSSGAVLKFKLTLSDGTFESTDEVTITIKNLTSIFAANGANHFNINYVTSLKLQQFSLATLFRTSSSFSGDAAIANRGGFGSESAGQNMNYGIWMNSAEKIVAGFETSGGADNFLTSSASYNEGAWHYAVVTFDGATLKLYVDGVQIGTKATTAKPDSSGTQALRIGANSRALDTYFTGSIDDVKLVKRALSSNEILQQFEIISLKMQGEVVYFDGETAFFAPIANAGPDQTAEEGNYVTLDGTASFDVGDNPITYTWTQTSGPISVTLSNSRATKPTFKAPSVAGSEVFTFQLEVDNGEYASTDTVKITVNDANVVAPKLLTTPNYKNDVAKAIKSADDYVYVSMFFVEVWSDNDPIQELAAAKARGVDVKLIISNQSLGLYPSLENDLKAKGIPYRIDSTHSKVVVIDDRFAYIGSANWNKNGLGNNWELTYKSNNPSTIAEAKEFVTQLWFKGSNMVRNNAMFPERLVNGFEYEEQVLSILQNAKSSIKVLMFEATYAPKDPSATQTKILNEVRNAYNRGVDLKMIFDDPRYWIMYGGKEFWDKYDIPHKLDDKDSGYLERKHVKAFLIDDSILVVGSQNWNRDSAGSPQEMSVIIKSNPDMVGDYQTLFTSQWNASNKCVVNQVVVPCS